MPFIVLQVLDREKSYSSPSSSTSSPAADPSDWGSSGGGSDNGYGDWEDPLNMQANLPRSKTLLYIIISCCTVYNHIVAFYSIFLCIFISCRSIR